MSCLAVAALVLALAGCTRPADQAQQAGAALAQSLQSGQWPQDQQSFGAEVDELIAGLDGERLEVEAREPEVDGDLALVPLHFTWLLPAGVWEYDTTVTFNRDEEGVWQPSLNPSIVHPELNQSVRLAQLVDQAPRQQIHSAGGDPLTAELPVMELGLDRGAVGEDQVESSARAIAEAVDVDPEPFIAAATGAGPRAFVTALVVRGNGPEQIPAEFDEIVGAAAHPNSRILTTPRGFAEELLGTVGEATAEQIEGSDGRIGPGQEVGRGGLQERYEQQLGGTPGARVLLVGSDSGKPIGEPLFEVPPRDGEPLTLTLDHDLQERAEATVDQVDPAAAIAVLRPSTGEVLALANNPAADGAQLANTGRFPPGSTFKIVTALALLRTGMSPDSPLDCPATLSVDGREFTNYSDYPAEHLGPVTLAEAIKYSCNTALIGAHEQLSGEQLQQAAASLGLGVDHDLGFPVLFGSVPLPESQVDLSAAMIGQGQVEATPLTMAAVAASVQQGRTVIPQLIAEPTPDQTPDDQSPAGTAPVAPLTPVEAGQLQELMAGVVDGGSAADLAPVAKGAKTGTAEYGTEVPPRTHAWMIAYGDDLAVAAFVADGESGSATAGPLVAALLE